MTQAAGAPNPRSPSPCWRSWPRWAARRSPARRDHDRVGEEDREEGAEEGEEGQQGRQPGAPGGGDAQSAAGAAQSAAGAAQSAADGAATTANSAQSAANQAQSAANQAGARIADIDAVRANTLTLDEGQSQALLPIGDVALLATCSEMGDNLSASILANHPGGVRRAAAGGR